MAKAPAKKKAAVKSAPSTNVIKRRNATVTLGKGVTLGKRAK